MNVPGIGPFTNSMLEVATPAKPPKKPLKHAFSQSLAEAEKVVKGAPAGINMPLRLEYGTLGGPTIRDLRESLETMKQTLSIDMKRAFEEAGVRVPPDVKLSVLPDGTVTAMGHPDQRAIDAYFQDHPQLYGLLQTALASAQWLRTGEEALAFQEAYRVNEDLAVSRFSHLFGDHPVNGGVSLLFSEEGHLTFLDARGSVS